MAERVRVVRVHREVVDVEYTHWCRPCALPSGLRVYVAVRLNARMHLQTHLLCDECGGTDVEANDG